MSQGFLMVWSQLALFPPVPGVTFFFVCPGPSRFMPAILPYLLIAPLTSTQQGLCWEGKCRHTVLTISAPASPFFPSCFFLSS